MCVLVCDYMQYTCSRVVLRSERVSDCQGMAVDPSSGAALCLFHFEECTLG